MKDPALRLLLATALVVVIGYAPIACSAARQVSPSTRDAIVRTAFEEFRYQCATNPPVDARLQAACLVVLDSGGGADGATREDAPKPVDKGPGSAGTSPSTPEATSPVPASSSPPVVTTPSAAGASFDPTPGNAVRMVAK